MDFASFFRGQERRAETIPHYGDVEVDTQELVNRASALIDDPAIASECALLARVAIGDMNAGILEPADVDYILFILEDQ